MIDRGQIERIIQFAKSDDKEMMALADNLLKNIDIKVDDMTELYSILRDHHDKKILSLMLPFNSNPKGCLFTTVEQLVVNDIDDTDTIKDTRIF